MRLTYDIIVERHCKMLMFLQVFIAERYKANQYEQRDGGCGQCPIKLVAPSSASQKLLIKRYSNTERDVPISWSLLLDLRVHPI